jgi:serine/threonine-protein kinase
VLDFGIAKVGGGTSKLTQAGQVFGTPHYMSPEQCAGTAVDHRTDIYALGVILYEMATGHVPFDADNLMGILTKHLYENPIAPHELPPPVNVPAALEAVILKCLIKKPEQRYQSMGELLDDLEAVETGLTPKAVVDQVERTTHGGQTSAEIGGGGRVTFGLGQPQTVTNIPGQRGKLPLVIGAGVVLLLGGGAFAMLGGGKANDDPHVVKPANGEQPAVPPPVPAPPPLPAAQPDPAPKPPEVPLTVTIKSEPAGAELYRDTALVGNTPLEFPKPKEGERVDLVLRLSGYENKTFSISTLTGAELKLTLDKQKAAPPPRRSGNSRRNDSEPKPDKDSKPEKPRRGVDTEVLDPWD